MSCQAAKSGGNLARWCNKDFEELYQKAKTTPKRAERAKFYAKAQEIMHEEAPWIEIAHSVLITPVRKEVLGYKMDQASHHYFHTVDLFTHLAAVARTRQLRVLMTSHNPALLDALPDAALADVLCCFRDVKHGDSRLVRLGDLARYPELAAQGPLGQLMTRRVLERFLNDDSTPEQRQSAALGWLATLQGGIASKQGACSVHPVDERRASRCVEIILLAMHTTLRFIFGDFLRIHWSSMVTIQPPMKTPAKQAQLQPAN